MEKSGSHHQAKKVTSTKFWVEASDFEAALWCCKSIYSPELMCKRLRSLMSMHHVIASDVNMSDVNASHVNASDVNATVLQVHIPGNIWICSTTVLHKNQRPRLFAMTLLVLSREGFLRLPMNSCLYCRKIPPGNCFFWGLMAVPVSCYTLVTGER